MTFFPSFFIFFPFFLFSLQSALEADLCKSPKGWGWYQAVPAVSVIIISCYSRNYIGKASAEPLSPCYYLNSLGAYVALESQS